MTLTIDEPPVAIATNSQRMELADAVEYFLLSIEAEGLSKRTIALYSDALRRMVAFARKHNRTHVDELTPTVLRGAVAEIKTHPGHSTNFKGGEAIQLTLVSAARSLSRHMQRDGISMPDLSVVKPPRMPERIQPRLTREEFLAIETATRNRAFRPRVQHMLVARDLAILYVLADTGLRAAEFCGLDVKDIDFEKGTLTVRHGKSGKDRMLSIADADPHEIDGGLTLRALRTYLFHREDRGLDEHRALWITQHGLRLTPNTLRLGLARQCDEAGIDGNRPPHAFRRGWFTAAYQSEPMALPILVARMGWSDKSGGEMARTYTRGVDIDLARTSLRPSLARQWSAPPALPLSTPPPPPRAQTGNSAGLATLAGPLLADPTFRDALLTAARDNPELRQSLVQALFGGAA